MFYFKEYETEVHFVINFLGFAYRPSTVHTFESENARLVVSTRTAEF